MLGFYSTQKADGEKQPLPLTARASLSSRPRLRKSRRDIVSSTLRGPFSRSPPPFVRLLCLRVQDGDSPSVGLRL
ncbi:hypothetical protein TGRH88_048840 [Toxoplasma gondii]|uniref:Uncharacterized protein n=1 Tax=Toxoplasma gondii TaxID=5811 RepID=A0A7J6JVA0_TOXGO|nr:hypothetical protein TGRH88_048840 [Toxoplasma gondii]